MILPNVINPTIAKCGIRRVMFTSPSFITWQEKAGHNVSFSLWPRFHSGET